MGVFSDLFGSDDAKSTQVTTSGPDPKIQQAAGTAVDRAINNSNRPFTPYDTNKRVPDLVDRYGPAFGLIDSSVGGYADDTAKIKSTLSDYMSGKTGIYDNIQKYMDPNLDALAKSQEDTLNRQYDIANRRSNSGLRASVGSASGDSGRWGLANAQMTKDKATAIADAITKLRSDAWDKAAGMSASDATARMNAAQQLMSALTGEKNLKTSDINSLLQAAGIEQGRVDQKAQADYEEFLRAQGWSDQQINTLLSQLGAASNLMSKTSTTEGTYDPGGNDLMRWLGVGISAAGAFLPTGGSKAGASIATQNYLPSIPSSASPYANQQWF